MKIFHGIWILGVIALALNVALAQDNPVQPSGSSGQDSGSEQTEPTPAYGQETMPPPVGENPPISGLDAPALEPHAAPLSYLQPGATISESGDSNAGISLGSQAAQSLSRALGSVILQRLWSHYDLMLDYVGGAEYNTLKALGWKSLQQMDVDQKITWKRGQLSLRDNFSYLPEGNFGGSYGSQGSQGIGSLGTAGFNGLLGGINLGTLGLAPRTTNVSVVDISENLTPKSAVTAAGAYAFTHFYGNDLNGGSFIGSSQISGEAGYNRLLSPHTQVALMYAYQGFDFSVFGTAFHTHVIEGMYGHRISGRMDFLVAAGPQVSLIDTPTEVCSDPTVPPILCRFFGHRLNPTTIKNTKLGVAGRVRLRYKFSRSSLDVGYQRFTSSGSGLFAGTETDLATMNVVRPLSRVWSAFADIGYSHNSRVQPLTAAQLAHCPRVSGSSSQNACPANDASAYGYGFFGGGLHRAFGRNFHAYISYQFNELSFDNSFCIGTAPCSRISNRHVGTIGLDWTPRPMRLD